jgi:hypothetical protein
MIPVLLLFLGGWAQAAPLPWFDLEVGKGFVLTQEVVLGGHPFAAGTQLFLEDSEPLPVPGAPLSFYTLYQSPCREPEAASQLEIIVPEGNPESSAVGVELSEGCNWGIYVEGKDLFTPSFLGQMLSF